MAAIVWAVIVLAAGVEFRGFEQRRSDGDTTRTTVSSVAQSFRSTRANLSAVDVELSSYLSMPEWGRVRLVEGDGPGGQTLYVLPFSSTNFTATNPYLRLSFPPIASSEGVTYTLVVESPGRRLSTALGVKFNTFDTLSSGNMYLDGKPQPGDLSMAAYYHYDLGLLWGDVLDALSSRILLALGWICLLWLPGLALLLYVPNGLSGQQRALAAPGLSVLALPVFLLLTRAVGLRLNSTLMWLLLLLCAAAILLKPVLPRLRSKTQPAASQIQNSKFKIQSSDVAFWGLLAGVMALSVTFRLLSLREAAAGMGLDAYHHTLIAEMFAQNGGIPSSYEPYAPLASFTYHYGFHALTAAIAWLTAQTAPTDIMTLMPQAGQIADALPVLTLTLFAWRTLGDRWAGLAAGALAGLACIFPAFYVNWSRYTQGLGLALLPIAWVFLVDAVRGSGVGGR
ncbi:MAG: hypothetical protein ACJ78Q_10135, partial [Chloroflexia bacterium]